MANPAVRLVLGTYVVRRFAHLRKGLRVPQGRDLVVGQGAVIEGSIDATAAVHLGQGVRVAGTIDAAGDVVVGAHALITGDVRTQQDAFLLDAARVEGSLTCGRSARIVEANVVGSVHCVGDVVVRGDARLGRVEAGGRVRTEARAPDPWPSMGST